MRFTELFDLPICLWKKEDITVLKWKKKKCCVIKPSFFLFSYLSVPFEKSSGCRYKITGLKDKNPSAATWPNHCVLKVNFYYFVYLKTDAYNYNAKTALTVGITVKVVVKCFL